MDAPLHPAAVVLVEVQGQWLRPGLYRSLIRREIESRRVLERLSALVAGARNAGALIVHAPLVLDPEAPRGRLARLTRARVFTRGTWRAELAPDLYAEGDPIVRGRYAFDGFVGSDLEVILRRAGTQTVHFCGFATDQCVARTVRSAIDKGFDARLVADCTATFAGWLQRRAEARLGDRVVTSSSVLAALL